MAFPTTLDTVKNTWLPTDRPIGHADHHDLMATLLMAIQARIGITGSAVTTSIDHQLSKRVGLVGDETIAGVKTFSDEVKITYGKGIFNNGYSTPALKTDWAFPNTGGSDSTRITPAGSAVTSNMVYSGAVRNGSKGDFYVEGNETITGDLSLDGKIIKSKKSDGVDIYIYKDLISSPNNHFHFLPDVTKDSAITNVIYFGYNAAISNYSFNSNWSGANKEILFMDGNTGKIKLPQGAFNRGILTSDASGNATWTDIFNNYGELNGTYSDFNLIDRFGPTFVGGTTNGPTHSGATQYYVISEGLGNEYDYSQYAMQMAIPRNATDPNVYIRYKESGSWGTWKSLGSSILQNSQSAAYTLVLGDAGKHIYHPSADTTPRTWTIPANSSVPFPIGTAITFINDTSAGTLTIAITTDTLVLAGAGTIGSRTLAANGMATAIKITATRWIINGTNLS